MDWFKALKESLPEHYSPANPEKVVGFLRGSAEPRVWRDLETRRNRNQMLILGNAEPDERDWQAAGVANRSTTHAILVDQLQDFIVLYGGFVFRPWGKIFILDEDAVLIGFPASLKSWQTNNPRTAR